VKKSILKQLGTALLIGCLISHVWAHADVKVVGDPLVLQEVVAVRAAIAAATQAKDAAKLKTLFTDDFTHTHGSGKVDGRDARIVSLLTSEPTIEMAHPDELVMHSYQGVTAILRGKSPILNARENLYYQFRWVQVFIKTPTGWKLAVSQATRLPDPPTKGN
jgi:ketosteroid isomerase-like protein